MSGILKPSNPWAPDLDVEVEVDVESGVMVSVSSQAFVDSADPTVTITQQPANGSATPAGPGLINVTLSQEGEDQALYTLTDTRGATSEVAILQLTGVQEAPPPPPPDPTGEPGSTGTATAVVSNYSQLSAAIGSAGSDAIIVLNDGNYSGSQLTVSKSNLTIRAANILGANVPGGFLLTGSNIILRGLDFNENATGTERVRVGGQNNQVWRCRFRYNGGQNNLHLINGSGGRVMYCGFTVVNPSDDYQPSSRNLGSWNNNSNQHYNAEIGYCYFYNLPRKPPQPEPYGLRARSAFGLNNYHLQSLTDAGWWIHHCLFENCGNSRFNVKMSGNTIEYCTITGKTGSNRTYSTDFNQRFGQNNTWRGCWSENADGYRVQGKGNKYISCKSVNSTATNVFPGDHDPPPIETGNPRADEAKLTACEFALQVGSPSWGGPLPARNTRIENHQGSVSLSNHTGTVQTGQMTETPVTPIKILPAMVGPFGTGV